MFQVFDMTKLINEYREDFKGTGSDLHKAPIRIRLSTLDCFITVTRKALDDYQLNPCKEMVSIINEGLLLSSMCYTT